MRKCFRLILIRINCIDGHLNRTVRFLFISDHFRIRNIRISGFIKPSRPVFICFFRRCIKCPGAQHILFYLKMPHNDDFKFLFRYGINDSGIRVPRHYIRTFISGRISIHPVKQVIKIQIRKIVLTPIRQKQIVLTITDRKNILPIQFTARLIKRRHPQRSVVRLVIHNKHIGFRHTISSSKQQIPFFRILPHIRGICGRAPVPQKSLFILRIPPDNVYRAF